VSIGQLLYSQASEFDISVPFRALRGNPWYIGLKVLLVASESGISAR
jgi:hypothetical protein